MLFNIHACNYYYYFYRYKMMELLLNIILILGTRYGLCLYLKVFRITK